MKIDRHIMFIAFICRRFLRYGPSTRAAVARLP